MCCSQLSAHSINCLALAMGFGTASSPCFTGQEGLVDPDLGCLPWLLGRERGLGSFQGGGVVLHVLVDTRVFPPAEPNNSGWGFRVFQ